MSRLLLPGLVLLAGSIYAQHPHETAKKSRATLLAGMGRHRHPIRASAEAQKFFDEGLTLVFGFNHEEAIRSFERAITIDPRAAMPYWGIALALGPNINLDVDPAGEKRAFDAARKALSMAV